MLKMVRLLSDTFTEARHLHQGPAEAAEIPITVIKCFFYGFTFVHSYTHTMLELLSCFMAAFLCVCVQCGLCIKMCKS